MLKPLKLRFFSLSIKIIIVYSAIIAVFAIAFFMTYYMSKIEISNKLMKVNEEYFLNKVGYIEATFKDIKNNAYELRNYMEMNRAEFDVDPYKKFEQINRLAKVVNYYDYMDDVFIYDMSTGYFICTQGSMDADVYFRATYFDDKLTEKWKDMVKTNEDIIVNITKYPYDEASKRTDYYKRLLYVDVDYFMMSKIVVGFVIDIEKVIRNENNINADINNFFIIKNNSENTLRDFLYHHLQYGIDENSLKKDGLVNTHRFGDNMVFYQLDANRQLIYLNVVNIEKYFKRLGYYNVLPIIMISLLLVLAIVVASSFLSRFYRNLKSIKSFIEGGFVKSLIAGQPGNDIMDEVKDFIGLSGIQQINVIMLSAIIKSVRISEIETHNYDDRFNKFLESNRIKYKSFDFIKLKRIYIIDAKSIKNYSAVLKSMQKLLNEHAERNEPIGINLFVSGIYDGKDGIEKAVDEVIYLSENVPVRTSNKVVLLEKDIQGDYKYIPDELKNMLCNAIACGDRQIVLKHIGDVISRNIQNGISVCNFKSLTEKINNILLEEIFERYTEYYDESVAVINKINNLVDSVGAEYLICFYEELMDKIPLAALSGENRGRNKLQQCFINYIEENYSKEIYLETMAEYFNLSPKYISLKFKEVTGDNFTEYLKRYRINVAKQLLKNTQQKINEISEKVGYNNVNVFIRHFKSIEGITPKTYREING